jgi:hypothetical protein
MSRKTDRVEQLRTKILADIAAAQESYKLLSDWDQQRRRAMNAMSKLKQLLEEVESVGAGAKVDARTLRHMEGEAGRWAENFLRPERIAEISAAHARRVRLQQLQSMLREPQDHKLYEQEHDELAKAVYGAGAVTHAEHQRRAEQARRARQKALYGVNAHGPE